MKSLRSFLRVGLVVLTALASLAAIFGSWLFVASTNGVALAWMRPESGTGFLNYTSAINPWAGNDCSGPVLLAQEGDTVDSTKWNQLFCRLYTIAVTLYDNYRNKTPFLQQVTNLVNGASGSYVSQIDLGATSTMDSQIRFHAAEATYEGEDLSPSSGRPWKWRLGTIRYTRNGSFGGIPDALWFNGFRGGIWINYTPNDTNASSFTTSGLVQGTKKSYAIGWEKVDIYGKEPFDPDCRYRVWGEGQSYDPKNWEWEAIRSSSIATAKWPDGHGGAVWFQIYADNKMQIKAYGSSSAVDASDGAVVSIDKFCVPSYNAAGHPDYVNNTPPTGSPVACGGSRPAHSTATTAATYNSGLGPHSWDFGTAVCGFSCDSGYGWDGTNCQSTATPTYQCTGAVPANATANPVTTYVAGQTPTSWTNGSASAICGFQCNAGYAWNGSSCQVQANVCGGTVPANATANSNNTYLTGQTPTSWTNGSASAICGFQCNAGYAWDGSSCAAAPSAAPTATGCLVGAMGGRIVVGPNTTEYMGDVYTNPDSQYPASTFIPNGGEVFFVNPSGRLCRYGSATCQSGTWNMFYVGSWECGSSR